MAADPKQIEKVLREAKPEQIKALAEALAVAIPASTIDRIAEARGTVADAKELREMSGDDFRNRFGETLRANAARR